MRGRSVWRRFKTCNESPFGEQSLKIHPFDKRSTKIVGNISDKMQNLGVNVFSFLFVSIYLFLVPRSINYVFIILFASLRTLYEPSSETQILIMVYNNTLIAKEMFKLSFFFISNAVFH